MSTAMIEIRRSRSEDIPEIMEIYRIAREFMREQGNPRQWGGTNWPPEELIRSDIRAGNSYVCISDGELAGTFFFMHGEDVEPTYRRIEDGSWLDDGPYGVIHRIAGNGSARGLGHEVFRWAAEQCGHLRIDTHPDNRVMQNLLKKEGFSFRGIIHVMEDTDPRLAFELV